MYPTQRPGGIIRRPSKDQRLVDQVTSNTINKLHAQTVATGVGMAQVTKVALAEEALNQLAPTAAGRLDFIAKRHAMAVADTLDDLQFQLRQL